MRDLDVGLRVAELALEQAAEIADALGILADVAAADA